MMQPEVRPVSISNPRNAATLVAYVAYFVFGLAVGPFRIHSVAIISVLPSWSEVMWAYSLLGGGLLFMLGAVFKEKLYFSLNLQSAGSAAVFWGLLTYAVAVMTNSGYPHGFPLTIILSGLGLASLCRSVSCALEIRRLKRVAQKPEKTLKVLAEESSKGHSFL